MPPSPHVEFPKFTYLYFFKKIEKKRKKTKKDWGGRSYNIFFFFFFGWNKGILNFSCLKNSCTAHGHSSVREDGILPLEKTKVVNGLITLKFQKFDWGT